MSTIVEAIRDRHNKKIPREWRPCTSIHSEVSGALEEYRIDAAGWIAELLSEVDRFREVSREAALLVQASRRDSITGCVAPELEALARAVDAMEVKP